MPEATRDNQDLEASVAALVGSKATKPEPRNRVAGGTSTGFTPTATPTPAATPPEGVPEPGASVSASSPAPPPEHDLAKAVEKLIQEQPAPATLSPSEPPPAKIETLDAQIADLADDLIAGEFADESSVVQGGVGEPPANQPPPPSSGTEKTGSAAPADRPGAEAALFEAAAPAAEPTWPQAVLAEAKVEPNPTSAPRPVSKPPPPIVKPAATSRQVAEMAAKVAARQGVKAARTLKPHGLKLLELISAPLLRKPKPIRDLIGWIALVTLFNAACLWMYVLFFRSAKVPEPTTPVVAVEHASDAKDQKSDKKDDKSKKSSKKESPKKDAAKKDTGKKKSAQANAGEH
jgi:hypothetical protein